MRKSVREGLERAIDAGIGITHDEWDYLQVDGPYLRSSYDLVKRLLLDLIHRALEGENRESA